VIVVLNGGSSSGKTSIARCLKARLGPRWLSLSVDDFVDALSGALWGAPEGLVIDDSGDVKPGADFRTLEAAWLAGVRAMSDAGAHLVLDDVFLDGGESQARTAALLGDTDIVWVGVLCDAEIAAGREIARGDRQAGMARKQAGRVHRGVVYDVEVDAGTNEAFDCAAAIAEFLRER
jgi:chloramphenicol 3-O phosphotransferase